MGVQVSTQERRSAVLTPSQLPCLADVPSVNLTSGCAHGCVYCYSRSYSLFPGEGRVVVYADTAERLRSELQRKRRIPTHVYFSPSTDVFQPVAEVLEMAFHIFALLLDRGVGIAFVTKGRIPERHMELLCSYPALVQTQIGVITPDEALARRLEPNAAPPSLRFEQMQRLIHAGIETRMRVAPIIPSLTDAEATLDTLFGNAAASGVSRASINALHLRPAIVASLRKHLERHEADEVLCRYAGAHPVHVCGDKSRQTPLAAAARIVLFERTRRIAKRHGIQAHACGCMNPDLTSERCALAGNWPAPDSGQMKLFQGED